MIDVDDRIFARCNWGVDSRHEVCEPVIADTQHIEKMLAELQKQMPEIQLYPEIKKQISISRQQGAQPQPQAGETDQPKYLLGSIKPSKTKQGTSKSLASIRQSRETKRMESSSSGASQ